MDSLGNGLLSPILDRIKKDDTLMLAIRDGYINVYYRGGNLVKITENPQSFTFNFDEKYDLSPANQQYNSLLLQKTIKDPIDVEKWIKAFPVLKELMDFWFSKYNRSEREFQQLVERENNRSRISNETEYFITDIELEDTNLGAKFDMTGLKWAADKRKTGISCKPVFIEMKYGDGNLDGSAGLVKHIQDFSQFISNTNKYNSAVESIENQFNQLHRLGLLNYNHSKSIEQVKLDSDIKPEFIFLLANHNPRSTKLKTILSSYEFKQYVDSEIFDLRFYSKSFGGYGLHGNNMLSYFDFMQQI
jgi:hypothetical protein